MLTDFCFFFIQRLITAKRVQPLLNSPLVLTPKSYLTVVQKLLFSHRAALYISAAPSHGASSFLPHSPCHSVQQNLYPSIAVPQVSKLSHPIPLFPKHFSRVTGHGAVGPATHMVVLCCHTQRCAEMTSFSTPRLQDMAVFLWGILLGFKLPTRQIHLSCRISGLSRSSMEKTSYCYAHRNESVCGQLQGALCLPRTGELRSSLGILRKAEEFLVLCFEMGFGLLSAISNLFLK